MANPITFTGLGSGIDMASIVTSLVDAEKQRHIIPFENWRTEWEDKIAAFQELNTKLASFHTSVKAIDTVGELFSKNVATSDADTATASASSSAINGAYTVEVSQLAAAEKTVHSGFADADTTEIHSDTVFDGDFSYTYNGVTRSLQVNAGSTLQDLADQINNDLDNPGVRASIINDGSGSAAAYHLVLAGSDTGSSYAITNISHTLDNLAGSGAAGAGFTVSQSARDALFRVDGYPTAPDYITRSSNTISDVISGVTLNLNGTGTATITLNTDVTSIKENIAAFVEAFNEIRTYIKQKTSFDADTNESGILLGNYAVDNIKNRLNAIISSSPSGFRNGTDAYVNLMQIGLKTDAEVGSETQGQLVIDESELDAALADNPQAIAELFSEYYAGRSMHSDLSYNSSLPGITDPGTYEIMFNAGDPSQSMMRKKGTAEWHSAVWDTTTETLTGASGYAEAGLSVRVTDVSTGFTGEVDLKQGIGGDLKDDLDLLTNPFDGPLAVLEENYQDIIDNINGKIDAEEKRIELLEQRLRERYARLEQVLTDLNGQSEYLAMRVSQLNTPG